MSLFSFDELKPAAQISDRSGSLHETGEVSAALIGQASGIIEMIVGQLQQERTVHFTSFGSFSMHQLLAHLLKITGPADVFIATWAMTEDPCRAIHALKESGVIRSLHLLFDYKIRERSPQALQLAEGIATSYKYSKCHAKTTVIVNDSWGISVIASANYTRNPRIERGLICCNPLVAAFDRDWILSEIQGTETEILSDELDR
jgi:hypothetical protein